MDDALRHQDAPPRGGRYRETTQCHRRPKRANLATRLGMYADAFRPSRRSDPLGRYYTGQTVSQFVVERLGPLRPRLVLDLGSGDGALSRAAIQRWKTARVVAVESHPRSCGVCTHRLEDRLRVVHADALGTTLSADVDLPLKSVSTAICNPPFIRPRWRHQFGGLLEDAHLSGCYAAIEEAGAAVLFLAQNLRFLKRHGLVALIVPDGILSGVKHRALRQALLSRHQVVQTVELPSGTFSRTEVMTHLLVVRKGGAQAAPVVMRRLMPEGISPPVVVPAQLCADRMDYSFHSLARLDWRMSRPASTLGELATTIERGRIVSSRRHQLPRPAFHTTELTGVEIVAPRRFCWSATAATKQPLVYATQGDILIARVGRRLHEKVAILRSGRIALTDCVFRVVVPKSHQEGVFRYLTSRTGRSELAARASGTGARHLAKAALSAIPIPNQLDR